jgi:hypothetical protein
MGARGIPEEKQIQIGDIGDEAYAMPEAMDKKGLKAKFHYLFSNKYDTHHLSTPCAWFAVEESMHTSSLSVGCVKARADSAEPTEFGERRPAGG